MELGTVDEVELIVDQIASNKIPPPNKAQSLVIIRQMVRLAKRIAELEKQLAANNPLLDEAADKIDAMEKQIRTLEMALAETEALEMSHGERIEKLMKQVAELEKERDIALAVAKESQANDRCAMGYLSQVRAVVGGDDFPDMVQRVTKLTAERDRLSELCDKWNTECDEMREDNKRLEEESQTAWAQAHRLALELECLLLDTKDTAIMSKWWDSGMAALSEYQEVQPQAKEQAEAWAAMRKVGI